MVKLSDIAQAAGTSIGTVSKVINDYPGISTATREKVLRVIKELGYVPNASARQLATSKSYLVGVVFSENLDVGLEHKFYAGVIEGFRQHMNALSYDVIFISTSEIGRKMSYLEHCRYRNLDGVFVCTFAGDDKALHDLFRSDFPCVTTDVVYDGIPLITSDNGAAMREAYDYLYGLGHRDIAHLYGPLDTVAGRERLKGFKEAAIRHRGSLRGVTAVPSEQFDYPSGYRAMTTLLETRDKLPDAVIASSDNIAIGAMRCLEDRGFEIPRDCSLVGVDDIELARYITPSLTTMAQDRRGLGKVVALSLAAQMAGKPLPMRTMLPMKLIERESCRRISP